MRTSERGRTRRCPVTLGNALDVRDATGTIPGVDVSVDDDDRERIERFLELPAYRRHPGLLLPSEADAEEA